ncbi:hypothetical protein TorRG33x02_305810, partial [Trema orientale]
MVGMVLHVEGNGTPSLGAATDVVELGAHWGFDENPLVRKKEKGMWEKDFAGGRERVRDGDCGG